MKGVSSRIRGRGRIVSEAAGRDGVGTCVLLIQYYYPEEEEEFFFLLLSSVDTTKMCNSDKQYNHVYNNTDENTQRACYIKNRTTDLFPSSIPSRNEFNCCILPGISSMDMRDALVNNLYGNRKRALVAVEFISSPRTLVSR